VLSDDPANGAAQALRDRVVETARRTALDAALRARAAETATHWAALRAGSRPQTDVVDLTPARLAELRTRQPADALGGRPDPPPEWETRLRHTLAKPVSFDFVETPLQDVLAFLSGLADVTIILDPEAVKDGSPSVTLRVSQMPLEKALGWVCKLVGLRYALRDEALYITHRVHNDAPVLRIYEVSDLTIPIQNFKGRHQALASDGGFQSTGAQGGTGQGTGNSVGEDFFGKNEEDQEEKPFTGQDLVRFIQRVIAPGTWWIEEGEEDALGRIEATR